MSHDPRNTLIEELEAENAWLRERLDALAGNGGYIGLNLTKRQECVLNILMAAKGRLTTDGILDLLTPRCEGYSKTVDVIICHLRKKLPADVRISNEWGRGYYLDPDSKAALAARRRA